MSDKKIVEHMIEYVEESEKDLIASKLFLETKEFSKRKNSLVTSIMNELEKAIKKDAEETNNEN